MAEGIGPPVHQIAVHRHHVGRHLREVLRAGVAEPAGQHPVGHVDELAGAQGEVVGSVVDHHVAGAARDGPAGAARLEAFVGHVRRHHEDVAEQRGHGPVLAVPAAHRRPQHPVAHGMGQKVQVTGAGLAGALAPVEELAHQPGEGEAAHVGRVLVVEIVPEPAHPLAARPDQRHHLHREAEAAQPPREQGRAREDVGLRAVGEAVEVDQHVFGGAAPQPVEEGGRADLPVVVGAQPLAEEERGARLGIGRKTHPAAEAALRALLQRAVGDEQHGTALPLAGRL
ncbi:hypothetical protein HRbin39_01697 [bacterium HR39]|nr:hypothetical protein HRbin39_01697 [bacterium HR39]